MQACVYSHALKYCSKIFNGGAKLFEGFVIKS